MNRPNPIPAELTPFSADDLVVRRRARRMEPPWPERSMAVVLFVRTAALERAGLRPDPSLLTKNLYPGITPKTPAGFTPVGFIALVEQPKARQKYGGLWFVQGARLDDAVRDMKLGAYLYSAAADLVRTEAYGRSGLISDEFFRSPAATRVWDSQVLAQHGYAVERDVFKEGDRVLR